MNSMANERYATVKERIISHVRLPLFRNGYLLTLSSAGSAGFGLVFWALAAHYYPAETIGVQSAVLSAMMLLAGFAVLGLNNVLIRYLQGAGQTVSRLIGLTYAISAAASVAISLAFLSVAAIWFPTLRFLISNGGWLLAFVIATAAWCVFSLQDFALTGLRQTQWIPLENLLFSFVKIILLVVFAGLPAGLGIFAAWNIPVALSLVPVNWLIFRRIVPEYIRARSSTDSPPRARQIAAYAAGNYLGSLFSIASVNLLPILVVTLDGAKGNAYFYLPWIIVNGLQLLALNMTTSLTVEATVDQAQLVAYCRHVLVHVTRLLVPAVIMILIGAPYILRVFGPDYATEGTQVLRWLALATVPNLIVLLGISLARVENRAGVVAIIQGAQAMLGLGLAAVFIGLWGLAGVGMAWLVSQLVVAVLVWWITLRPVFAAPTATSRAGKKSFDTLSQG